MRCLVVSILVLLVGCAPTASVQTTYDDARATTTLETRRVLLTNRDLTGALRTQQRVFVQATASCAGRGCVPDEVDLAFINGSDFQLDIDPREVEVTVDGRSRSWTNEGLRREALGVTVVRGEFLRITVPVADFVRLASAQDVGVSFGRTGTSPYVATYDRREPFRDLAERLSGTPS